MLPLALLLDALPMLAPPAPAALPKLRLIVFGFWPVNELRKLMVSLALASSSVSSFTWRFSSAICCVLGSSFLIGLFEMKLALDAYDSVDRFSSICASHGFRQASMRVKLLPPRD